MHRVSASSRRVGSRTRRDVTHINDNAALTDTNPGSMPGLSLRVLSYLQSDKPRAIDLQLMRLLEFLCELLHFGIQADEKGDERFDTPGTIDMGVRREERWCTSMNLTFNVLLQSYAYSESTRCWRGDIESLYSSDRRKESLSSASCQSNGGLRIRSFNARRPFLFSLQEEA